jgi:alpha-glucosidase (family GH31 glycosyl hydrolase)
MSLSYRSFSFTILAIIIGLAILPLPTLDAAVGFVVAETDGGNTVVADAGAWGLRIEKNPLRINVLRDGKTVAATAPGNLGWASIEGGKVEFRVLESWSCVGDGLLLELSSQEDNGNRAFASITPFQDRALVRVWLPGEPFCDKIEHTWSLKDGGHWYGGNITSTHIWPLESGQIELDPFLASSNQTSPIWLSSSGAGFFVPTYQPMGFAVNRDGDGLFRFNVKQTAHLEYTLIIRENIVGAHDTFTNLAGRPRTVPPRGYFARPIFNTWIEFHIDVNQQGVIEYANTMRDNEFGCDVFMIDDRWQAHYGDRVFDAAKFPQPGAMVDSMHALGFKVILWVVPFVDFDAENFAYLKQRGWLVLQADGATPAGIEWWNGTSALVDLSNPEAFGWYVDQLKGLQRRYGVDGFKLDAGDAEFFKPEFVTFGNVSPNRYTDLFAEVGTHFLINEYRVSWLMQNRGLVQRLRDKNNNWSVESGLGSLVPHGMSEGLIGYPYFCPDIIGGGLDGDFISEDFQGMDPELFVRWCQASCLMPMMQFSFAPWKLDDTSAAICLKYARLHEQYGDYIYSLALDSQSSGLPIARPLFFLDPADETTYRINNQFMLGDSLLVAPVLEKDAVARDVYLPRGQWTDYHTGQSHEGPKLLTAYPAPLEILPVFIRNN